MLLLFGLSANALYVLGVNYAGNDGGMLERLHPALGVALVMLAMVPFIRRPDVAGHASTVSSQQSGGLLLAAGVITLVWAVVSPNAGGELTIPIVTFILPGILILAFSKLNQGTSDWISIFVFWFFVCNSVLGIVGVATGFNLLPQLAGTVEIISDRRPTALLGHPLTNAQMTGVYFTFVALKTLKDGLTPTKLLLLGLHGAGLASFGGRTALTTAVVVIAIYVLYRIYVTLATSSSRSFVSVLLFVVIASISIPFAFSSGLADDILTRFTDDGGSAATRLSALQILGQLSYEQWILGVGPAQRIQLQLALGTQFGIENFVIALLTSYGLPIAALLIGAMIQALRSIARPLGGIGGWLVLYFLVTSLGSLSLGSKTTNLSLFIVMLLAFRPKIPGASEAKSAAAASVPDEPYSRKLRLTPLPERR